MLKIYLNKNKLYTAKDEKVKKKKLIEKNKNHYC